MLLTRRLPLRRRSVVRAVLSILFWGPASNVFAAEGPPVITAVSAPRQVLTAGQSLTLSVTATGATSYQWKRNGLAIGGATNASYVITGAQPLRDNGRYQAVATNGSGLTVASTVFVSVAPAVSRILAWGFGSAGLPDGVSTATAIFTGNMKTGYLKSDGTVAGWGDNFPEPPVGLGNVVSLALGTNYFGYAVALKADGTVVAWGENSSGQATVPVGLTNVVAVAAGFSHSLALRADGTVVAWGSSSYGATAVPSGLTGVIAIAAGEGFSVALKSDGTVVGWGRNDQGQSTVPLGLANVVAISARYEHCLALKADGTVLGWGRDNFGQATATGSLTGVAAVAAGFEHSLALRSDGTVMGWGPPGNSELTLPANLNHVFSIAADHTHSVVLRDASGDLIPSIASQPANVNAFTGQDVTFSVTANAGTAMLSYQWRKGGNAIAGATASVLTLSRVVTTDAGSYDVVVTDPLGSITSQAASLAVSATPAVGLNVTGRTIVAKGGSLGLAGTAAIPGPVSYQWRRNGLPISGATTANFSVTNATSRDAGVYQLVATNGVGSALSEPVFVGISYSNQILAFGSNTSGQTTVPAGLGSVVSLAAGASHSLALKTDGTVAAWGYNSSGQIQVPAGLTDVVAVAAGQSFSMALRGNGTVATWGAINFTPAGIASVVAIVAGASEAFALKSDGTVVAWNNEGIITLPLAGQEVVALAAGNQFYLALRRNGTVFAWGTLTGSGQTVVPAGLQGVVAVAAGAAHALALKSDGTVVAWGYNGSGVASVPAGLSGVIGVAARFYTSYALKFDGSIVFWGQYDSSVPETVDSVRMLSVGESHLLALRDSSGDAAPAISIQPGNRTAAVGSNATFSVTATGSPAPTYQWQRKGALDSAFTNLSEGGGFVGTITANLSVNAYSLGMSGDQYRVLVSNGIGSPVTSNVATLTVAQAPVITTGNAATFVGGAFNSFTFTATGSPAPTFSITGTLPAGVTFDGATGMISGTPLDATGSPFTLTVQATNSAGSATQTFTLTVARRPGLINLSVLMNVPSDGVVGMLRVSGSGAKTLLIRGVGPTLGSAPFNIAGVLNDPQMELTNLITGELVAANDNWGGSPAINNASIQVGAFALSNASSRDSALLVTCAPGTYAVKLSGAAGANGTALLEIYDAGGAASLSYLAYRAPVGTGMTVGFVTTGSTPTTLLVRAAGPALTAAGGLGDPVLSVLSGSMVVASNDNWSASLAATMSQVGAFPFAIGSRDSALLTTLAPGSYTAQVSPVGTTGVALLEVFDLEASSSPNAPYFVTSPASQVVNVGTNVTLSALAAGSSNMAYQWRKDNADIAGATNATLTLNNVQVANSGIYSVIGTSSVGFAISQSATLTVNQPLPPAITSATGAGTINVGLPTVFTVVASGTGSLTYQWRKDTVAIVGATNATLAIGSAQLSDSGTYDCLVSNLGGTTTSSGLVLNVVAIPPTITVQPVGGNLSVGGSILLSVTATGSPALSYQWRRNGIPLFGATSATFGIPNAQTWDNGDYEVTVTSPYGSTTSVPVHLTVVARPVSISARVVIGSGEPAIATFTVEGTVAKNLLLRAVGPGFTPFGINNVAPDPQLDVFDAAGNLVASNNDWSSASNAAAISSTTAAVGAFGLAVGSRDSAVLQAFAPGNYTVRATGNGGVGGVALLELHDADLPANGSRVPFVAVRARVGPGEALMIGGLASNGRGVRSYLIRAVGPGLGLVHGVFANPSLVVAREGVLVANSDDWDAVAADGLAVATATSRVAAFPLAAGSYDAAVVVTGNVHAGAHTVQVGDGNGGGIVLVELHDLDASRPTAFAPVVVSPPFPREAAALGTSLIFAARAHGTPPLSYQWRRDGVNLAGATSDTLTIPNAQLSDGGLYSVVVTNSAGTATSLPALATVSGVGGVVSAMHATVENGYLPGGILTIANTFTFTTAASSLGWEVVLPAGWSFVSDAGSAGDFKPAVGATGRLEWAWVNPPASPVTFSYKVNIPAGEVGAKMLTATAIIRTGTNGEILNVAPYPLVVAPNTRYHSADTNLDNRISLLELTRVIELYNTRNGTVRTGAYKVDASGEDGFASDAARLVAEPVTLTRYHSGDTQGATAGTPPDGKLSLLELTRVIELYNCRSGTVRTGQYHPQAGTEDGMAPGP